MSQIQKTQNMVWRSLLYVPANNQRFVEKAHTRGVDMILMDLEERSGERA